MFFFRRKKSKIQVVESIPHGSHWSAVLGEEPEKESQAILGTIDQAVQNSQSATVFELKKGRKTQEIVLIETEFNAITVSVILVENELWSAYPKLNSSLFPSQHKAEIPTVLEWDNHIEAQIVAELFRPEVKLEFFATDYLKNKDKYVDAKSLHLNLSGIAYAIGIGGAESFEGSRSGIKFAPNFTGLFPSEYRSEYDFIGEIKEVQTAKFLEKDALVLYTKVCGTEEEEFTLPLGVLKSSVERTPQKGEFVQSAFWLAGNTLK